MAFPVFNLIAEYFYSMFGGGLVLSLVIISIVILAILSIKGDISVMLLLIIPLVVGFVVNNVGTNFLELPAWIIIALFIVGGLLFSLAIASTIRN